MFVYESGSTFTDNGLGGLTPTECLITEDLNGQFELTMTHPIDPYGKWSKLQVNNVIKASTHRGDQYFRIYDIDTDAIKGSIVVSARHVFYDLLNNFIEALTITSQTGDAAGDAILANCQFASGFTFSSDIVDAKSTTFERTNPVQALIGEGPETFVHVWGGELKRDNWAIEINSRIGADNGAKVTYRKNLSWLRMVENTKDVVTRIYPYATGANDELLGLPEKYVDSTKIGNYPMPVVKAIVFRDVRLGSDVFPTADDVYTELRARVAMLYADGVDTPSLTFKAEMVDLSQTEEYAQFVQTGIGLGDDVTVAYTPLGIDEKLRVVQVVWDALKERYKSLTIGDPLSTFERHIANIEWNVYTLNTRGTTAQGIDVITTTQETVTDYSTLTPGSPYTFRSAAVMRPRVASIDSTHALVGYTDLSDDEHGKVVLATITGSEIAYGSVQEFANVAVNHLEMVALDSSHVLITYTEYMGDKSGKAIVAEIIDGSISLGTAATFELDQTEQVSVCRLDGTHALIIYRDVYNDGYGTARLATITGTSISVGSAVVFNAGYTYDMGVSALDSSHAIITFEDNGNSDKGTAVIATISEGSVSFGSEYVFNDAVTSYTSVAGLDSTHAVIAFMDGSNSNKGAAVVATVDGSSISFGTKVLYSSGAAYNNKVNAIDATHVFITHNGGPAMVVVGTVTGSAITFGTPGSLGTTEAYETSSSLLSATTMIGVFSDEAADYYGKGTVVQLGTTTTTQQIRIRTTKENGLEITVNDTQVFGFSVDDVYLRYPGGDPDNRVGCDVTGPYMIIGGAKRYVTDEIDTLSGDVSTIEGDISTINGNITTINNRLAALESNVWGGM